MNLTGRLTKDAEVRTTSRNKQVLNFSVSVNDSYKTKEGERIEQTAFFDCSYWRTPKVADYLPKGTLVELSGRVSARTWTANDGEVRAGLNFHTSQIKLHSLARTDGRSGKKAETVEATEQSKTVKAVPQGIEDDLPF